MYYSKILKIVFIIFFNSCSLFSQELIPFKSGDYYGFMNEKKEIIIEPEYLKVDRFYNNKNTTVKFDSNNSGIIDKEGNIILKIESTQILRIYNNIFSIDTFLDRYLYNLDSKKTIAEKFLSVNTTNDGRIPIKFEEANSATYIDSNGNNLYPNMGFRKTYPFSNGVAIVLEEDWYSSLIDENGNYVKKKVYGSPTGKKFTDGLCLAVNLDGETGFINENGDFVFILPRTITQSENITYTSFNNGYAAFINKVEENRNYWTIINDEIDIVAEDIKFRSTTKCEDGFFKVTVYTEDEDKWNFINPNGHFLSDVNFNKAENFVNGYAIILKDGKDGLISEDGEIFYIDEIMR